MRGLTWDTERPIYKSLPSIFETYQGNDAVDYITQFWDELLIDTKANVDDVERQLDPLTCDEEYLPLLSYVTGFTGKYSILNYTVEQQRTLISRAFDFIWRYKGTEQVLTFILDTLEIPHIIWYSNFLLADISTVPHTIGEGNYKAYILLSISVTRNGDIWNKALLNRELYTAAFSETTLAYDCFYADYSAAGDPVFDTPTISKNNLPT